MGRRLAILVGCVYPESNHPLNGSINDVKAMWNLLPRFGFKTHGNPRGAFMMYDVPGALAPIEETVFPTRTNIMSILNQWVDASGPGDVLFFYFSGRGSLIPASDGYPEEVAIVPSDHNLITNSDFCRLINRMPAGSNFTIVLDSSYSGGLVHKKEQFPHARHVTPHATPLIKTITIQAIVSSLAIRSNIRSHHVGDHLQRLFGQEVSLRFTVPAHHYAPLLILRPECGILLSACQKDEHAIQKGSRGEDAHGAFTKALKMVLAENPTRNLSNKDLMTQIREMMHHDRSPQHPGLYCSDHNAHAKFLLHN